MMMQIYLLHGVEIDDHYTIGAFFTEQEVSEATETIVSKHCHLKAGDWEKCTDGGYLFQRVENDSTCHVESCHPRLVGFRVEICNLGVDEHHLRRLLNEAGGE